MHPRARTVDNARPFAPIRASLGAALLTIFLTAWLAACGGEPQPPPTTDLSSDLREAVTTEGIMEHARRFQKIADEHGGNRTAGTPGYDASADYVADSLRAAGYEVRVQSFGLPGYAVLRDATLEVSGTPVAATNFALMDGSGPGEVEAGLRPVDARGATSGCEAADFEGLGRGEVALLRRGTCTFRAKAENAERAGASAALIFEAGEGGVLRGSLGGADVNIPVVGTGASFGEGLLAREEPPPVRLSVAEGGSERTTNVIAETPGGDEESTVMLGAHLDSVPEGPGINDNGSGSATVLEIAEELAELDTKPRNKVRFAFWGAEEIGLVGSRHYVEGLGDGDLAEISAYLNLDMTGSPNPVTSVYEGPDDVEDVFGSYFGAREVEFETNSALDGRSDHGPFQEEGVPTGGLFSGAGGLKTEDQQDAFGGEAGAPFDACYHRPCDDIDNLDKESLDRLSDAAAHATAVLAEGDGA